MTQSLSGRTATEITLPDGNARLEGGQAAGPRVRAHRLASDHPW